MVKLQITDHAGVDSNYDPRFDDYGFVAQEGLISWLKDVGDRIKANMRGVKFSSIRALITGIKDVKEFDYSDMADRTPGHPMYSKQQLDAYLADVKAAASVVQSKILPFFKTALSCSAKDIENYFNKSDWSKVDKKNKFEVNDRAAFDYWTKLRNDESNPLRRLMRYTSEGWFYNQKNINKDDRIDLRKNYSSSKTYAKLGYNSPSDFLGMFQLALAEMEMKESAVFGSMYKAAFELDKACSDLLRTKIRGTRYTDLPTGLYPLYQIVNLGVFWTYYTDDNAFWIPSANDNQFAAEKVTMHRLARVLNVDLDA